MSYYTRTQFIRPETVLKDSQASIKAWLKRKRALRIARGDVSLAEYAARHDRQNVTVDDVLSHFAPEVKAEIAEKDAAAKRETPSYIQYGDGKGGYTPERQRLHQEIIDSILTPEAIKAATPKDGKAPNLVILGGRGGSGKSKFTNGTLNEFDARHHVVLDSDLVKWNEKTKIGLKPPYSGWNAFSVHKESSDVMNMLHEKATALGLNVVHDVTLSSLNIEPKLDDMRKRGYTVEGHYMHLSAEDAAGRAVSRYLGKGPDARGRLVPVDVVLSMTDNERNFDTLKPKFDKWSAYDNSGPSGTTPKLIARGAKS